MVGSKKRGGRLKKEDVVEEVTELKVPVDDGEVIIELKIEEFEDSKPLKVVEKVWIKKEEPVCSLTEDMVARRLDAAGATLFAVDMDEAFLGRTFSRALITKVLGGSTQAEFANVALGNGRPQYRALICPSRQWNPHIPLRPGEPGLLFSPADQLKEKRPCPLFIRLAANNWQHLGEYVLVDSQPLSQEEWLQLPQECRDVWVQCILDSNWGQGMHRSILAGRADKTQDRLAKEEVEKAFRTGTEVFYVSVLKCTGYDNTVQRDLIAEKDQQDELERLEALLQAELKERKKAAKANKSQSPGTKASVPSSDRQTRSNGKRKSERPVPSAGPPPKRPRISVRA